MPVVKGLLLFLGLALGVHAALRWVLGPSVPLPLEAVPLTRLAGGFLTGAAGAALMVDVLRPLATGRTRATAVAFLGTLPMVLAMQVAVAGWGRWGLPDVVRLALLCGLAAVPGARLIRSVGPRPDDDGSADRR